MAVYERTYRPYVGELTPRSGRFLILPKYAYQAILSKRLFVAFLVACFVWPLLLAVMIYLPHNSSFLKLLGTQAGGDVFAFNFDARFFLFGYMVPQGGLSLFLAFIIGPELISGDMRNNAMPLYLSRPFSRTEYILGKVSVMVILLSMITWVPGMLLFFLQSYLEGWSWFTGNLRIGAAIFLASWLYITVLCLISLALSAYVKWKPLARMGMFVIFFVAAGFSNVLNLLLETKWASLFYVGDMVHVAWTRLFGVQSWIDIPAWAAWTSLLVMCGFCILLLARKIRAYEVVR